MTETQIWQALIESLPSLGVGVIFVYLYIQERKWSRERDGQIQEMYADAIKAQVGFTSALDNNTRAIQTMTEKVEKILEHDD